MSEQSELVKVDSCGQSRYSFRDYQASVHSSRLQILDMDQASPKDAQYFNGHLRDLLIDHESFDAYDSQAIVI